MPILNSQTFKIKGHRRLIRIAVSILLTIVPQRKDGLYAGTPNIYRALINGIGEIERKEVRRFINYLHTLSKKKSKD